MGRMGDSLAKHFPSPTQIATRLSQADTTKASVAIATTSPTYLASATPNVLPKPVPTEMLMAQIPNLTVVPEKKTASPANQEPTSQAPLSDVTHNAILPIKVPSLGVSLKPLPTGVVIAGIRILEAEAKYDAQIKEKIASLVASGKLPEDKADEAYLLAMVATKQGATPLRNGAGGTRSGLLHLDINKFPRADANNPAKALDLFFEGDAGVAALLSAGKPLGDIAKAAGMTTNQKAFEDALPLVSASLGEEGALTAEALKVTIANDATLSKGSALANINFVVPVAGTYDKEHLSASHVKFVQGILQDTQQVLNEVEQRTGKAFTHKERSEITLQVLMAARQESTYANLQYGDADSMGPFQQRPSQSWPNAGGSVLAQTRDFLLGVNTNVGLLTMREKYPSDSYPLGKAIQATQRSAHPALYDRWLPEASALLAATTQQEMPLSDIKLALAGKD
jgi:hypothetical protein